MNKTIKVAFIISVLAFPACSKHIPAEFEVVRMRLVNTDNSGAGPVEAINDSVPRKAYAIKMKLDAVMRVKTEGDAQENGFVNEDQLIAMNIFSLKNFDDAHPALSSLNAYFLTERNSSATIDEFVSKGQLGEGVYVNGSYTDSWSAEQYLYLMTPPTLPGIQAFVVKADFSDGRSLTDTVSVNLY